MKRPTYRERDHDFGKAMLALRTAMDLTQAELSDVLGVSRYAIGGWELGDKYPKARHLKHFIEVALQKKVFPSGNEAEEIRALWELSHQKIAIDEHWLTSLIADTVHESPTEKVTALTQADSRRLDWGDALTVNGFYGREDELNLLTSWVVKERCRVVSVIGFGGIGKSSLVVQLMHQIAHEFEVVIWRSLRDVPDYDMLLDSCLHVLSPQPLEELPDSLEERQNLLLRYMRTNRTLLILDNFESTLEESGNAGHLRPEYENLGRVLYLAAGTNHQSCVVLTSREKPSDLGSVEGRHAPVRTLRLTQLATDACKRLLAEKNVTGSDLDKAKLIEAYHGNPLALKIVTQTIVELFSGEIMLFLEQGELIFAGVRRLLNEHFARLSPLEQDVMIWLAILREPASLAVLQNVIVRATASAELLEAILSLSRRSLIEPGQIRGSFTLQSVVLEYVTARMINDAVKEIEGGQLVHLGKYGIELAHTREYVREIQQRLIVTPILDRLCNTFSTQHSLESHLHDLLSNMSNQAQPEQGYGPANIVVLLKSLRGNLRGVDLSGLVLRDMYLQGIEMQDTRLVNTTLDHSFFTESFDVLTAVAVNSTGKYWAASSRRGEIRIWEAGGQILHHSWQGHTSTVWALTFNPAGDLLASGCNDGSLTLWEVDTGNLRWSTRHAGDVNRLSFSPDGLRLAGAGDGDDRCVYLWHVPDGELLQTIPHPNSVAAVAWSPDGQVLASGDGKGFVRLWAMHPTEPARLLHTLSEHTGCTDGLAFAPDSHMLASASWDGTVKLWEIPDGRLLQTLTGHTNRVGRVVWSPDGKMIASSSADQNILLWDVERGSYRSALRGHSSHVYDLAFTSESRNLLSSSRDGSLRVWDVVNERCTRVINGYAGSIYDVDWSPDNHMLVSGGTDLVVTIWDVGTQSPVQVLQEHVGFVCAVGWSLDGRWLASSETEYGIRLWDLNANEHFRFLRNPDNKGNFPYSLAWSPDSTYLASGSHQHGMKVWNVRTGEEVWIGRHATSWYPRIVWSPNGTYLAGGGVDGNISIWNVPQDELAQQLSGHQGRIMSLAWSADGKRLASGARGAIEGELFVWELESGQRSHSFTGHSSTVTAVAWDSSGRYLISGGGHGYLCWWDTRIGEQTRIRNAHNGAVQSIKRSPDGTKLASCGDDGAIMIWDIVSGELVHTLRRDRPYERLDITGIRGLTETQIGTLHALGAITHDNT